MSCTLRSKRCSRTYVFHLGSLGGGKGGARKSRRADALGVGRRGCHACRCALMSSQLEVLPRSMLGPLAQQHHRVNQATIERTSHNGAATRVIQLACNVLEWKFDFLAIRRRRRYLLTSGNQPSLYTDVSTYAHKDHLIHCSGVLSFATHTRPASSCAEDVSEVKIKQPLPAW